MHFYPSNWGLGGRGNHPPLLDEHPVDLRPDCKLEFGHCDQVEKSQRALYPSLLSLGGQMKFKNT